MATLLCDDVLERLEPALQSFAKLDEAAAHAGVHRSTLWRWRKHAAELAVARDEGAHGPWTEDEQLHLRLHEVLEQASPVGKARALMEIREAGVGVPVTVTTTKTVTDKEGKVTTTVTVVERRVRAWQALAWLLERKFPEEFALIGREPMPVGDGLPEDAEADALIAETWALLDEVAARRTMHEADEASG